MHIVFGGAFNGKREYVKKRLAGQEVDWFESKLPKSPAVSAAIVVAGIEHRIKSQLASGISEFHIREELQEMLAKYKDNKLIWVLTDMNRGIVPIDPLERELRDVLGRIYQFLFSEATEITRIWYGIPQNLKGGDGR
ncbi:bifunctional adenosylcobinamide kinase/adenosylcobinamide-phosphate guanylyltransferase [Planococcus ruber]|uniref:bifunctional adenosylcobinamide kinase/adenosylcobinamide-phosphate guanylyltransferase n=1 Tax=Planococcus ruber TaxID=2027871 RepID=UPI001FEDFBC9|nr:bifunctional adenosylcobinamide kinase/adenosylcobinamide-phosphate guanylyltransferase [Planococcus ruber]MCJ1908154.1 bifunctional adenosylcobinamide kinase/adenosylcobinamide-phosphate guanylyltransferase [Planococcus ruber]